MIVSPYLLIPLQKIDLAEGQAACFCCDNLALVLAVQGKMEEAEPYFWKVCTYYT